ncbi:MAG: AlpA family phage regulatory protein [Gemmatimonadetes bacterium]|nr:AlpA family phage regulatory protein [Gemmatimonadota bacterium]
MTASAPTPTPTGLLRLPEVLQRVGVSESTWRHRVNSGIAPQAVPLGARAVAWRAADIDAYVLAHTP